MLMNLQNIWLLAATLDFGAALLHLAIIAGGSAWYRFFGAGEHMAAMAARGHPWPAIVTFSIAMGLATFGAYTMTVGGFFSQLPWPKTILCGIAGIYGLRAGIPLLLAPFMASMRTPFALWSSGMCGLFALVHYGSLL
jgi:putative oxidoreductase